MPPKYNKNMGAINIIFYYYWDSPIKRKKLINYWRIHIR